MVSDVLHYGLLTYQGLADGTVSIETFFRAKRQAKFMAWLKNKALHMGHNEEVEYFE